MPMNATSDAIQRPRQSNIELLRIAAMLLILVLHANFFALGAYEPEDFKTDPLPTATRILFEQAAIYAVNLFVLISGWFGIRTKTKSLTALMFQYAFFFILLLIVPGWIEAGSPTRLWPAIRQGLSLNAYWFVPSYLILCLLAPGLNAFAEQSSRRRLGRTVAAFYAIQFVCAWMFDGAGGIFQRGYSPVAFAGLYLLARYVRLYRPLPFLSSARTQYLIAAVLIVCPALTEVCLLRFDGSTAYSWWRQHGTSYLAPHVVFCALFILTATARLRFTSLFVNRIAASAFAVYLLHLHPCVVGHFKLAVQWLYDHYSDAAFLLLTFGLLVTIFAAAVLVDQVRLLCWRPLARRLFPQRIHPSES